MRKGFVTFGIKWNLEGFEMKIEVNLNKCQGYAQCVAEAPEIFTLNTDGLAEVLSASVTADDEKYAVAAADLEHLQEN